MVPRENKNNAYAKFWRDKQRSLWYSSKWPVCLIAPLFVDGDSVILGKNPSAALQKSNRSTTFRLLDCPAILLGCKLSKWSAFAIMVKEMLYDNPG